MAPRVVRSIDRKTDKNAKCLLIMIIHTDIFFEPRQVSLKQVPDFGHTKGTADQSVLIIRGIHLLLSAYNFATHEQLLLKSI